MFECLSPPRPPLPHSVGRHANGCVKQAVHTQRVVADLLCCHGVVCCHDAALYPGPQPYEALHNCANEGHFGVPENLYTLFVQRLRPLWVVASGTAKPMPAWASGTPPLPQPSACPAEV
uniref:Uncharacterized protein n=1 Tax=Eutreptiella gymnastica TaxID=73025 RepID=A0A7S1JIP6_9EUGL|mmetsp:Transcript_99600/g.171512  ORF Transcript_99600/g.171512 Transcript_99600/m.171512 type:complete len:119 (+) Transcript_99600:595-951(+)